MSQPTRARAGQRMDITGRSWPLQSGLPFGPIPTAVPCARAHATQVLWEWGMAEISDTAELIVSELMTNAVAASRALEGGPFPVPPVRMEPAADVEGGRGLMLVDALSTQWDWYPVADKIEGKAVWALISP